MEKKWKRMKQETKEKNGKESSRKEKRSRKQ